MPPFDDPLGSPIKKNKVKVIWGGEGSKMEMSY